jgi:hypothetical protein
VEDSFREAADVAVDHNKSIAVVHMVPRLTSKEKNANVHFIICRCTLEEKAIILERLNKEK